MNSSEESNRVKFPRQQKPLEIFSFSSLTDIVFLLLIFFLLSSSFVLQPGVKVQLPKSDKAEQESQRQIVITVTEKGALFLNDQPVTTANLGSRLSGLLQKDRDKVVVIKADRTVSLQNAVEVMDIAKGVGATRLLIATQPSS